MKSKGKTKKRKVKSNFLLKLIVVFVFIGMIAIVIHLAPNYIREEANEKMKVIIDNQDVTEQIKTEIYIDEKEIVYMEIKDIATFFDKDIYYDSQNNQIITTSNENTATVPLEQKEMYINNSKVKIYGLATKKEENVYLPFSEMKIVYHVEINYVEETNTLTIDSLYKEQKRGNASKNISIKYMPTLFSKTVDKVKKGDSMIAIEKLKNGWTKVRTSLGNIGYTKNITNIYTVREQMESNE